MITKRQLGISLVYFGVLVILGTILADVEFFGVSEHDGIGSVQRIAFMIGGALTIIGFTLFPLGNKPA